jgi:beta-galactosidase
VPGQTNQIVVPDEGTYSCDLWSEVIHLEGAQALAHYAQDFYAGRPAVTRHGFGQGTAYYLGTRPDAQFIDSLLGRVCREAGAHPLLETPPGVEAVRRVGEERSFLFLLNHLQESCEIQLGGPTRDLLTGEDHDGHLTLDPYGVAILESREP